MQVERTSSIACPVAAVIRIAQALSGFTGCKRWTSLMKTLDGFNKEMGQAISSISFMFIYSMKCLIQHKNRVVKTGDSIFSD